MTDHLDQAVDRGIITADQRAAIRALAGEGEPLPDAAAAESREGFNAVTIAYFIGAAVVLFGFGWFLVDRWRALGAGGVLVVSSLYAGLFLLVARWLRGHGYPLASAFALVLMVGMAPIVGWAALELAGVWPAGQPYCRSAMPFLWECTGKWIVLDLITIGVGLIVLRRWPHPLLMHPIAVALVFLVAHGVEALGFGRFGVGWAAIVGASLLLWLAYEVDGRVEMPGDYGFWLWAAGLVTALAGLTMVWDYERPLRHVLPVIVVGSFAIAILLRRRLFVVFGGIGVIWYMAHLVSLFRDVVALPVMLATMGLLIILGAVWMQRNYPRLVRRADEAGLGARRLPGGPFPLIAPGLLGVLLLFGPVQARDRQDRLEQIGQQRVFEARMRREAILARRRDSVLAAQGDTAAARRFTERTSGPRNRIPRAP